MPWSRLRHENELNYRLVEAEGLVDREMRVESFLVLDILDYIIGAKVRIPWTIPRPTSPPTSAPTSE